MTSKDKMISYLPKIFRNDDFVNTILNSNGIKLDEVISSLDQLNKNLNFSTMDIETIQLYEKELNYKTSSEAIADKRGEIEARWKLRAKCSIDTLRDIAASFPNGTISVVFVGGFIVVEFVDETGIPANLAAVREALETAKPAHLPIEYIFKYTIWLTVKQTYTWQQIINLALRWIDLRGGTIGKWYALESSSWLDLENQNKTWQDLEGGDF